MRSSRNLLLSAGAAAAALVLSACGSSSSTRTTDQQTVTVVTTVSAASSQPIPPAAGGAGAASGGTTSDTSSTATRTSTTKPVGAACTASVLTASYLGSNGAAGTIELGFALTNSGSRTCHTYGWPGVQLLSSSDAMLPTDAKRVETDLQGSAPPVLLNLEPGDEASFRIFETDSSAGGRSCATATQLQIIAPDDTATMKVALAGGVPACGRTTVSPVLPGRSAYASQ
jgi:Protein of unknown function (DUF4232)